MDTSAMPTPTNSAHSGYVKFSYLVEECWAMLEIRIHYVGEEEDSLTFVLIKQHYN